MNSPTWLVSGARVIRAPKEAADLYPGAVVLCNVHDSFECFGRPCVIHRPTNHRMVGWPLRWRDDRRIFERICRHGVGHPDPDQFDFWRSQGREHETIHGCDGCCFSGAST